MVPYFTFTSKVGFKSKVLYRYYTIPSFFKQTLQQKNFLAWLFSSSRTKMPTLFTDEGNPFAIKVLAASYVFEYPLQTNIVKKKDFNLPGCFSQQLPILEVQPGKYLFNPNAASNFIYKQSRQASSQCKLTFQKMDELLEWESQKLMPTVLPIMLSALSESKKTSTHVSSMTNTFSFIDGLLSKELRLIGSTTTIADVVIWASLYGVMQIKDIQDIAIKYPALMKWFNELSATNSCKKAIDQVVGEKGIDAFKSSLEGYTFALSQHKNHTDQKIVKSEDHHHDVKPAGEVSEEDVEKAKLHCLKNKEGAPKLRQRQHPILPKKGEKNILITAALPYVNNVPHLGNIIGCVLSADVYSRYCRLRNYNSLYVSGTDEYGTATETKAISEGLTPQEICDKYHDIHSSIYKWFNIDFDHFGRTTSPEQKTMVQDIFLKVKENGFLITDSVDQLQCKSCDRFLADRFVEGICPFCAYEDARGDQCDACGKLINAVELKKPRCKLCGSPPEIKTSEHIFLDLPKIEPKLKDWVQKSQEENWSSNARHITKGWLNEGLKPRCITRDLKWGISVPMEGFKSKVFYVWFDAPIGYISMTACYTDQWEQWWKNQEEVKLVQFMAKDNVPFHTVMFPSSLIAADDNFTMLSEISATEYLNYENDKFSKSRGVGVFGDHAESTGIPADIFRFYLLYVRPETQDSAFQWSDFMLKNNSELLNNLGNFVNRALMFLKNSFNSTIPELHLTDEDYHLIASVNMDLAEYVEYLDKIKLREGLRVILNISRAGNQYIQSCKPWVLVKGSESEKSRAGTVIGLAVNLSALLSILIQPYMPDISAQLQDQINVSKNAYAIPDFFVPMLMPGHKTGTPSVLFQKLSPELGEELKNRFAGAKLETKVADKPKPTPPVSTSVGSADPVKAAQLEKEVATQGDVVRKAKSEKASKDVIDTEVKKLLDLKKLLAVAQGLDPNATNKQNKGKKGKKK